MSTEENLYNVYTDGGSRGNPGPAAIGFVIKQNGLVVKEGSEYIGEGTNNIAEYKALLAALTELENLPKATVALFLDSLLVVEQINGNYKMKNPGLLPLYNEVKKKLATMPTFTITHIPRAQNARADELVNLALDKQLKESHVE